jgi:hypothetical protein
MPNEDVKKRTRRSWGGKKLRGSVMSYFRDDGVSRNDDQA